MIFSNYIDQIPSEELIRFLQNELSLSGRAIELGIRKSQSERAPISIVLWHLGLINYVQYQLLLDWILKLK